MHQVEPRAFLSRIEGFQLFLQLDRNEVTHMEDWIVPDVQAYRLDLHFTSPLGVMARVSKTLPFPVLACSLTHAPRVPPSPEQTVQAWNRQCRRVPYSWVMDNAKLPGTSRPISSRTSGGWRPLWRPRRLSTASTSPPTCPGR